MFSRMLYSLLKKTSRPLSATASPSLFMCVTLCLILGLTIISNPTSINAAQPIASANPTKTPIAKQATKRPNSKPVDPKHAIKMAQGIALFKKNVKPILIAQCLDCHGGEKTKGEFDLTTREKLIDGGFEAEGIVPGDHKKSQI